MALTTLQKTLKAAEFQAILNRNPRLKKFHQEIQEQNAKIDNLINKISTHLLNDDVAKADQEISQFAQDNLKPMQSTKSPVRAAIASKITPFKGS